MMKSNDEQEIRVEMYLLTAAATAETATAIQSARFCVRHVAFIQHTTNADAQTQTVRSEENKSAWLPKTSSVNTHVHRVITVIP